MLLSIRYTKRSNLQLVAIGVMLKIIYFMEHHRSNRLCISTDLVLTLSGRIFYKYLYLIRSRKAIVRSLV